MKRWRITIRKTGSDDDDNERERDEKKMDRVWKIYDVKRE